LVNKICACPSAIRGWLAKSARKPGHRSIRNSPRAPRGGRGLCIFCAFRLRSGQALWFRSGWQVGKAFHISSLTRFASDTQSPIVLPDRRSRSWLRPQNPTTTSKPAVGPWFSA